MCVNKQTSTRNWNVWGWAVVSAVCAGSAAQSPEGGGEVAVRTGTITANDVYVRSGDSLNHYTISKLQAGDTVQVVGERGDWYEITPPEGTFSLVSGDFIDAADNQNGVINGDNVRVRAGSLLNENKYTVQTLLTKGTPVTVLGRNPDGFVRIKPPLGATVWMNRSYVSFGGASGVVEAKPVVPTPSENPESTGSTPVPTPAAGSAKLPGAPMSTGVTESWRRKLEETDAAARTELSKPVLERRLGPVLAGYQPIVDQTEDSFAREYAQARLHQVKDFADLTETVARMRSLDEQADSKRQDFLAGRNRIPEPEPINPPTGIEVQGVLRISALYPPESSNPRYRLVEPGDVNERTIGYVEFPRDAGVNVEAFLGRHVGVRATAQRIQQGGVKPVPIYIARELVYMDALPSAPAADGPR